MRSAAVPERELWDVEANSPNEVTMMLARAAQGDESAVAELMPVVYDRLRGLAGDFFRHERPNHTLQPTALVHEAYVKLLGTADTDWQNRAHFFAVAARAMRQILTDHARSKRAAKRGGDQRHRVTLSGLKTPPGVSEIDLIALDEALTKLDRVDPRQCQIVELRFLAGLGVEDIAQLLELSGATVKREWRMARAWLRRELGGESET